MSLGSDLAVALAPTLAVFTTAWFARRRGAGQAAQLEQIQVTVNGRLETALAKIEHLEQLLADRVDGPASSHAAGP